MRAQSPTILKSKHEVEPFLDRYLLEGASARRIHPALSLLLKTIDFLLAAVPYPVRRFISKLYSLAINKRVFGKDNADRIFSLVGFPSAMSLVLFFALNNNREISLFFLATACASLVLVIWNTWLRQASLDEVCKIVVLFDEDPPSVLTAPMARWARDRSLRRGDLRFLYMASIQRNELRHILLDALIDGPVSVDAPNFGYFTPWRTVRRVFGKLAESYTSAATVRAQVDQALRSSTRLREEMVRLDAEDQRTNLEEGTPAVAATSAARRPDRP